MGGHHRDTADLIVRVVIVEDEPMIARRLERVTREVVGPRLQSVHCVSSIDSATAHLTRGDESVLLLDLSLSGEDGFDMLRSALAEPCSTIVVSANTNRALEAFELGVVDFVPKPFTAERLALAFERVTERRGTERTRYVAVSIAGRVDLIPIDEVVAVHGDDDYSSIETLSGQRRLHKRTLAELETLLSTTFQRVHRSHLVNMVHVRQVLTHDSGGRSVLLANGSEVPVSRSCIDALGKRLIG